MRRQTKAAVVAALAVLLFADSATGRSEDTLSNELSGLSPLLGEWSGSGWIAGRGGKKAHFESKEWVEARIGGDVILIEGLHRASNGQRAGEITHHAMALVSWDEAKKRIRFDSFVKGRGRADFTGRVEGQKFIWGREEGEGRRFRYTIELSKKNSWNEVGEYSVDGETWTQFFEMRLKREQ